VSSETFSSALYSAHRHKNKTLADWSQITAQSNGCVCEVSLFSSPPDNQNAKEDGDRAAHPFTVVVE
jgi:hypothetical protein